MAICDKCGQEVPANNSTLELEFEIRCQGSKEMRETMLRMRADGSLQQRDRHLFEIPGVCEGSPSRAQYLGQREDPRGIYKLDGETMRRVAEGWWAMRKRLGITEVREGLTLHWYSHGLKGKVPPLLVAMFGPPPDNKILYHPDDETFYISFIHKTDPDGGMFANEEGKDETALCIRKDDGDVNFFVLNGDFREQYRTAIAAHGKVGAIEVWEANQEKARSLWSEPSGDNESPRQMMGLLALLMKRKLERDLGIKGEDEKGS